MVLPRNLGICQFEPYIVKQRRGVQRMPWHSTSAVALLTVKGYSLGMKSPVFVILLILNLLTCPLRCLACEASATVGVENTCAPCKCCSHCCDEDSPAPTESQDPVPHDPEPREDDCGCKDCICEGAVVEDALEFPEPSPALVWLWPIAIDGTSPAVVGLKLTLTALRDSVPILTGRGARIAHQSWQI